MAKGKLVNAEERNKMLRLSLSGMKRGQIARECRRSLATVYKILGPIKKKHEPRDPVTV
jgi:Mor family transcriptional regulator